MSDNIFNNRFYSYREPAWHRLGYVTDEEIGAREGLVKIGRYDVATEPLYLADGTKIDYRAILRSPTVDDPVRRVFGVVGEEYSLITPTEFCDLWDEHVTRHIETIGILGHGERLFITTKLPNFQVRGDEVDNYLLAHSPMNGVEALEVINSPVRTVCANTLRLAQNMAVERYRIIHSPQMRTYLAEYLTSIIDRATERSEAIEAACNILANHTVSAINMADVLNATYPYPRFDQVNRVGPADLIKRREERYEYAHKTAEIRRTAIIDLFNGAGTGMDTEAAKGTAWGLYNAVVELEDYRRGRGDRSTAENAIFGSRAQVKERAFNACLEISRN